MGWKELAQSVKENVEIVACNFLPAMALGGCGDVVEYGPVEVVLDADRFFEKLNQLAHRPFLVVVGEHDGPDQRRFAANVTSCDICVTFKKYPYDGNIAHGGCPMDSCMALIVDGPVRRISWRRNWGQWRFKTSRCCVIRSQDEVVEECIAVHLVMLLRDSDFWCTLALTRPAGVIVTIYVIFIHERS